QSQVRVSLAGEEREATVLAVQDDISSAAEGWAKGKSLGDSLNKAWQGFNSVTDWKPIHALSTAVGRWPGAAVAPAPEATESPAAVDANVAPQRVGAPVELFFTRNGGQAPDRDLADFIRSAGKTVDIAAFELHSDVIR